MIQAVIQADIDSEISDRLDRSTIDWGALPITSVIHAIWSTSFSPFTHRFSGLFGLGTSMQSTASTFNYCTSIAKQYLDIDSHCCAALEPCWEVCERCRTMHDDCCILHGVQCLNNGTSTNQEILGAQSPSLQQCNPMTRYQLPGHMVNPRWPANSGNVTQLENHPCTA